MHAPAGLDAVALARSRARKWLRVFQQLVRVLDRLEERSDSLLAAALVFLVQRALGRLEDGEPVSAVASERDVELEASECSGDELLAAVDLARPAPDRRDVREDPASAELEVLLLLAGALTDSQESSTFDDFSVPTEALVKEYRSLKHFSPQDVLSVPLFPDSFRKRWSALLQAAASEDPQRRLALELSVMRVIHALYAMAIGYRRSSTFGRPDPDCDAWLASSLGEATLQLVRR